MCCGRVCMLCTCLILLVIAIGFLFGFGVFKDGFHKIQQSVHLECDPRSGCGGGGVGRRGYGFTAPAGIVSGFPNAYEFQSPSSLARKQIESQLQRQQIPTEEEKPEQTIRTS